MEKKGFDKNKNLFVISVVFLVLLGILLVIANYNKDFTNTKLRKNNKTIFSVTDLKVNDLEFGDNVKTIEKKLGKPKSIKKTKKNNFGYRIYNYNGLKLLLRENYKDYMLVGVEVTKSKYKTSRNIRVGDGVLKVIKNYKVEDRTGNYIYRNFKLSSINDKSNKENIYLGYRDNKRIMYINRDVVTDDTFINVANITYYYKNGKVNKIIWSYDFN